MPSITPSVSTSVRAGVASVAAIAVLLVAGCNNNPAGQLARVMPVSQSTVSVFRALCSILGTCFSQDVLTQHNDNARTGAQLAETALTPDSISATTFGLLYDRHVLGTILAQPLYLHAVSTPSGVKNLIFIATAEDIVYAFDADDTSADTTTNAPTADPGAPGGVAPESTKWIWRASLGHPHVGDICPETVPALVGITSTPVIDRSAGLIYVVARDQTGANASHPLGRDNLHALNVSTGADVRQQVVDAAPVNGMAFHDACQRQRPGLLLQGGVIYLGYGTYQCDQPCASDPYRGWILGFHANDFSPAGAYTNSATPAEGGMGVWASGNGLAGGPGGSIYYETGNDLPYGPTLAALGDAFVKLHGDGTTLTLDTHYPAPDAATLKNGDTDLGAGGPMLLPGGKLIGGGKDGRFFVLNQADLQPSQTAFQAFYNTFHYGPAAYPYNSPAVYSVTCHDYAAAHGLPQSGIYGVAYEGEPCYLDVSTYKAGESYGPNIHAGPVFWRDSSGHGFVYKMAEKDYLKAFDYNVGTGAVSSTPAHVATVRPSHDGMPGGFSSVSANGQAHGVVWTVVQQQNSMFGYPYPAVLYAHDASNLHELWNNADDAVILAKFNAPTIADGRVILPSVGLFQVYGLHTPINLVHFPIYYPIRRLPPEEAIQRRWSNLGGAAGLLGHAVGPLQKDAVGGLSQDYEALVDGGGYGQVSVGPQVRISAPMCDGKTRYHPDLPIQSTIYASAKTGAHYVSGEIRRLFLEQGGVAKFGYPVTDEVPTPDGFGLMTRFEHGVVHWYPGHAAELGEPRLPEPPAKRSDIAAALPAMSVRRG